MITKAAATMAEYAAGLGIDAARDRFKNKIDEIKLRSAFTDYIEHQKEYNEVCSLAEEIDFQGLIEYITENLLDDVSTRIFHPNNKVRGRARGNIVSAAIAYSEANTKEAQCRVTKCILTCLDIIREFYSSSFSEKDYILAAEIVDAVAEHVNEIAQNSTMAIVDEIRSSADTVLAKVSDNSALFSIDKAVALAEGGQISDIGDGIRKLLKHISPEHPDFPNFGFDYVNGKLRSKPLTEEAKKRFPPRLLLTGAVRFGNQYYNNPDGDPLDYAYRHQIPVVMEVSKAVKYLGDKPDPLQDEVRKLEGSTVLATPPKFPPAFPCAIKIGTKTYFEYVLLRTQEILDDGTYVISNKEQGGSLYFEVKINAKELGKSDFKINLNHPSNRELLDYVRFMDTLSSEKDLHIHVLSAKEDLFVGQVNNINYKTGFPSVAEEIDFLERVCDIEDYFKVKLDTYGNISSNEHEMVVRISDLIRNDEVMGTWVESTFTGTLDQHFREELLNMGTGQHMLSYVGVIEVELFGASFEFRFMRSLKCACMVDYDKVKKKVEVLDDGDSIKITFRAGEDNTAIDTLKIPEKMESAL